MSQFKEKSGSVGSAEFEEALFSGSDSKEPVDQDGGKGDKQEKPKDAKSKKAEQAMLEGIFVMQRAIDERGKAEKDKAEKAEKPKQKVITIEKVV